MTNTKLFAKTIPFMSVEFEQKRTNFSLITHFIHRLWFFHIRLIKPSDYLNKVLQLLIKHYRMTI